MRLIALLHWWLSEWQEKRRQRRVEEIRNIRFRACWDEYFSRGGQW